MNQKLIERLVNKTLKERETTIKCGFSIFYLMGDAHIHEITYH